MQGEYVMNKYTNAALCAKEEVLVGTIYTIAVKRKTGPQKGECAYARPMANNQLAFQPWTGWTTPAQFNDLQKAEAWWDENKSKLDMAEIKEYFDMDTLCIKERITVEKEYRKL